MGARENLAGHTASAEAEDRHDLTHHGDYMHDDTEFDPPALEPIVRIDAYVAMMQAIVAIVSGSRPRESSSSSLA